MLLAVVAICTLLALIQTSANAAAAATVEFSSGTYTVDKSGGDPLDISIVRHGDLSGDACVYLNVSGGTAVYPDNYNLDMQLSTPIHFAPGVAEYAIRLTPSDNGLREGDKTTILRLVSPSGADLGSNSIALVTIRDTEVAGPTPSPIATVTLVPTAGAPAGTPKPASGTPTLIPLPSPSSQAPFPGALLTLTAMVTGCILLRRRRL